MEISAVIAELKTEASRIEPKITNLTEAIEQLRTSLSAAEQDLAFFTDRLTAVNMSIESLELLDKAPVRPACETADAVKPAVKPQVNRYSRKPKRIAKLDARGNRIGTYSSINQCAKAIGWTNAGVRKYIENVSREKQIKLRGFILAWAE